MDVESFVEKNRSVIYGAMLGDATIPIAEGRNTLLQIAHGVDQKDYLFHKYEMLKAVAHPPRFGDYGTHGRRWSFNTVRHKAWQKVWSVFHENSKKRTRAGRTYIPKVITKTILASLDDKGVALWWVDDGFVSFGWNEETSQWREFGKLSTCDFTFEENELALQWFREVYGATGTVHLQRVQKSERTYPIIYFSWQECLKIFGRISPFVPECMKHKIDLEAAKLWKSRTLLWPHGLSVDEDGEIENVEEHLRHGVGCGSYPV